MSFDAVEQIARAVLYEGYLLYPYRPSALKNRQRWMFGRVLPRDYSLAHAESEPWTIQTECLVVGAGRTVLESRVRFLQLAQRADESCDQAAEAVEREVAAAVSLDEITGRPRRVDFAFPPRGESGSPPNGMNSVLLEGAVVLSAGEAGEGLFKLTVTIENLTPCGAEQKLDQALARSLISTHTMLHVTGGDFVSLLDPPEPYAAVAATCRNVGAWPVLVGPEPGKMVLSAPIILYDYPRIAPESPGDLFDGTEIDELLTLRIQTLTDEERSEMIAAGEHTRTLLERTESLTEEQLEQMHGRLQSVPAPQSVDRTSAQQRPDLARLWCPPKADPACASVSEIRLRRTPQITTSPGARGAAPTPVRDFRPGDRVRLRPCGGADAFDLLLNGQTATIISVEHDFEDRVHLGVVVDDDPGKDFGLRGLPGHRFFFRPGDVERLPVTQARPTVTQARPTVTQPRILVAGIGNIFLGDDAFGVEVLRQWSQRPPADGVRAVDFGIRGFDLACAILDGYDVVVLVDAVLRGGPPGTLYVIEPDLESLTAAEAEPAAEGHAMSPERVLQWVQAMGGPVPPIRLVGCEPAALASEEEPQMGLSPPVTEAVHQAIGMIQSLIDDLRAEWVKRNNDTVVGTRRVP